MTVVNKLEVSAMFPVQPVAPATPWRPRWAIVTAALGLPVALMGFVTGSLVSAVAARFKELLGLWDVVLLHVVAVGPAIAGGYLLLRFLQRSNRVAFSWGVTLVVISAVVTAATSGVWLSPPV